VAGLVLTGPTVSAPKSLPILKWPGGKRWLALAMATSARLRVGDRIIEPFVGGGALFFGVRPAAALLGDINGDLIACYRAVRDSPAIVYGELAEMTLDRDTYARVAAAVPRTDVERAVRMIYLNRTAFAGIWRVNQSGKFNVPFGCKPETRPPEWAIIEQASTALQAATLYEGDYTLGLASAGDSDFIYCDPPYTVSHNNNGFIRYNEKLFSWADQKRLAVIAQSLAQDGRRIAISNAAHDDVMSLYPRKVFTLAVIRRRSSLAALPEHRGERQEVLIVSKAIAGSPKRLRDSLLRQGLNVEVT
jgi:DNA adenine methylase